MPNVNRYLSRPALGLKDYCRLNRAILAERSEFLEALNTGYERAISVEADKLGLLVAKSRIVARDCGF